jgi:hypothetical protein
MRSLVLHYNALTHGRAGLVLIGGLSSINRPMPASGAPSGLTVNCEASHT